MALATARDDGWQAAAMQAMSATNPEVLTALGLDQRVRVRAALATNQHLPAAVSQELWEWTRVHPGDESRAARQSLLEVIDVTWLAQNALGEPFTDSEWAKIARRAVASERREVYEAFAECRSSEAAAHFTAHLVQYRGTPPYSATELAAFRPPERSTHWITRAASLSKGLGVEIANLLVAHNADVPTSLSSVTNEALDVFVAAGIANEAGAKQLSDLLTAKLTSEQIDHVLVGLETRSKDFVRALAGLIRTRQVIRVNAEQLDAITAALEHHEIRYRSYELLAAMHRTATNKSSYTPTPESLFRLMCNGDVATLQMWVSNAMPSEPRPQDISRILGDSMQRALTGGEIGSLLHRVDFSLSPEWIDIIVDATGQVFFTILTNKQACEYMVKRVISVLGEDPRAWSLLWRTLATWEGSLGGAIAATKTALEQ
jgi:hypothetical protein